MRVSTAAASLTRSKYVEKPPPLPLPVPADDEDSLVEVVPAAAAALPSFALAEPAGAAATGACVAYAVN